MNKSSDPDRTPVAKDVFTWCTREKTETWHVVRNHNAQGIVDRVVCKACSSEHQYRRVKAAAPARATSNRVIVRGSSPAAARSSAAEKEAASHGALEATWFAGLKRWGEKPLRPFDATVSFAVGEVFDHSVFGKGIVQGRRENKIDVLFKIGMKTLPSTMQKPGA